jgi:hypothetical protein
MSAPGFVSFTGSLSLIPSQAGLVDYDYQTLTVQCNLVLTTGAGDFQLATVWVGSGPRTGPSIVPIPLSAYSGEAGTLSLKCQVASANNGGQFILIGGGRFSWLS